MADHVRVMHFLNQFFAQIGGEEFALTQPQLMKGPLGPGILLQKNLEGEGEVIATVICGDDYFAGSMEKAKKQLMDFIGDERPDVLIAGPAFNAGRYGIACGELCKAAKEKFALTCITGMYRENPGVDLYRKSTYIMETAASALGMKTAVPKIAEFALRVYRGLPVGPPEDEGYFPQQIRKNILSEDLASERAIRMLIAKLSGLPYESEVSDSSATTFNPAPPLRTMRKAKIALVTEGALVPKGNPDHLEGSRCTKFGCYDLWPGGNPPSGHFECIHRGFDTTSINADPNRLLPVDVLVQMEKQRRFAELFPLFYSTCGCGTFVESAERIGKEIAEALKVNGVDGVILVAT